MHFQYRSVFSFTFVVAILASVSLLGNNSDKNKKDQVRICLVTSVKNNVATIEQCLNSVKDIVDCVCIYDCGSTDKTLSVVEEFNFKTAIPVRFHQGISSNVEKTKTNSLRAAERYIKELGFPLSSTYFLVLDPDMIVQVGPSFTKKALQKDCYAFLEKSSTLPYYTYNTRLLRASLPWENVGIVHDHWISSEEITTIKLSSLKVEEQGDEKTRTERLRRHLLLITEYAKMDPENKHFLFQRALLHRCLGEFEEAIHWFSERIQREESEDEVWFSKLMLGECYEEKGEWNRALSCYLDAYQYDPKRAESLRKIATHYRLLGQNDLSYMFAKHGSRIPLPNNRSLYSSSIHSYQFDEELSIAAYYTQFQEEGFDAINNLVIKKNVPWFIRDQAYRNMLFYIPKLKNAKFQKITPDLPRIVEDSSELYKPMNPSIVKTTDGYRLICRTVNYTQTGAKIFNTIDPHGIFRTRNFLLRYDQNFKMLSQQEIIEDLPREKLRNLVEGLEDCRIFALDNSYWFTCTTSDTNPTGTRQISLCKLRDDVAATSVDVEKLLPLQGPDPFRCEKNWAPFVKDNQLHIVYSYDPFIVFKPNFTTGECEKVVEHFPKLNFSHFRGSAAPILFDGGYLILVHEVVTQPDFHRCYLHRFLFADQDFVVQKLSKPFIFQHAGIEFCCSMTMDHSGKNLILPIGIEDCEAYLCCIDIATVRTLLEDLPTVFESSL